MKKCLFICLLVFMLTGCKNEMKCSLEKNENDYKIKQEVVLGYDKDEFVTSAETTITMIFETEEEAQEYYEIFGELEQKSELKIEKNKLIMKDDEEYSNKSKVSELKDQLEQSNYICD